MKLCTVFLSYHGDPARDLGARRGPSTKKAPPAPAAWCFAAAPYSWTGFHSGVRRRRSRGRQGDGTTQPFAPLQHGDYYTLSVDNGFAGASVPTSASFPLSARSRWARDYQMDRFVVGAFTDFDLRSLSRRRAIPEAARPIATLHNAPTPYHNVWYKVGNSWDAGVRLGYLVTDRNLLYALGGFSAARRFLRARGSISTTPVAPMRTPPCEPIRVGSRARCSAPAGKTAITDHITLKAEYRYADYGKARSSLLVVDHFL